MTSLEFRGEFISQSLQVKDGRLRMPGAKHPSRYSVNYGVHRDDKPITASESSIIEFAFEIYVMCGEQSQSLC